MTCVCIRLGARWEVLGEVGDMVGFGLYQFTNGESGVCVLVAVKGDKLVWW